MSETTILWFFKTFQISRIKLLLELPHFQLFYPHNKEIPIMHPMFYLKFKTFLLTLFVQFYLRDIFLGEESYMMEMTSAICWSSILVIGYYET
jgi:hypothetical protein